MPLCCQLLACLRGIYTRSRVLDLFKVFFYQSGYLSEHRNPIPQRYRSEHSMRMRQLYIVRYYFRSNVAAELVVVIFRLKVDVFDSFEEVQSNKRKSKK